MAELRHIEHILATQADFRADGDLGQLGVLTDQSEEMVYKNDDATKEFHVANQYYWNGAANVYSANAFGQITMFDDILVAEYIKRSGGTDDLIRFENDKITVQAGGVTVAVFENDQIFFDFGLKIKEAAAAVADTAGYGQYRVMNDTPCTPWFTDDAGNDTQIATVGSAKGEMFAYDVTETTTINTQDAYHAVKGLGAGSLSGWTFQDGRVVDANITSEADNTVLRIVTSAAHLLTTGDIVTCTNMNNAAHNAPTIVTVIDATTFDCDNIPYVADAGASAGVIDEPAYLEAGGAAAGDYSVNYSCSGEAAGADTFKLEVWAGATEHNNTAAKLDLGINDLGPIPGTGFIDGIVEGDRLWVAIENTTGTANFIATNINMNLHRL